ncbi:MAG: O-antigen ligase family protein [Ignavibacteriae bacterium]|nr:O-antigen ligase family protein [Ignavibacteriota bacterium]
MITTLLVPIGAVVFLSLNRFYQFTVLSLAALLPFSFGNFRSIPNFQFIEWMPILVFLLLINEFIIINKARSKEKRLNFNGLQIFIFSILILIIWAAISYFQNEVFTTYYTNMANTGKTRIYFTIINNIILYFSVSIFIVQYFEQIDFQKFFKTLLYIALFLGFLRIIAHFLDFNIPFLSGAFDYGGEYGKYRKIQYGGTAYRLGGLSEVVIIGIPSLFAIYVSDKKINYFALLSLLFFLFLSGGRTVLIGTFVSIFIVSFFFFPRNFIYLIGVGALFVIAAAIFLPESVLQGQTGRLTTLDAGNFMGQDAFRGLAWKFYIETFLENPIFGKGINVYSGFIFSSVRNAEEFARDLLFAGGHGSYFSLLAIFGIGGITYFILFEFGAIILSFSKIKYFFDTNQTLTSISVFAFMMLIIKSVDFITAVNGINVPILFYLAGVISSVKIYQNKFGL